MKQSLIYTVWFSVVLFAAVARNHSLPVNGAKTTVLWEILDYVHHHISDEGDIYGSA